MVEDIAQPEQKKPLTPTQMLNKCWEHPAYLLDTDTVPSAPSDIIHILSYSLDQYPHQPEDPYSEELQSVRKIYKDKMNKFSPLRYLRKNVAEDLKIKDTKQEFVAIHIAKEAKNQNLLPSPNMGEPTIDSTGIHCSNPLTARKIESWLTVISLAALDPTKIDQPYPLINNWNTLVQEFPADQQAIFTIREPTFKSFRTLLLSIETPEPTVSNKLIVSRQDFLKELQDRKVPGATPLKNLLSSPGKDS